MKESFGKTYSISSKKRIEEVFTKGHRIKQFPLMMRYLEIKDDFPTPFQIAISVPKRNFKQAVKRNRIKRLIKESVRKNKYIIEEKVPQNGVKLILFLIFSDKEMPDYQKINHSIESLFQKLPTQKDND